MRIMKMMRKMNFGKEDIDMKHGEKIVKVRGNKFKIEYDQGTFATSKLDGTKRRISAAKITHKGTIQDNIKRTWKLNPYREEK